MAIDKAIDSAALDAELTNIADAIRGVNGRSHSFKIRYGAFAEEVGKLDPAITPYAGSFENGYYGIRAVKCAASYLAARVLGTDKFAYRTETIFSPSLLVRDNGYGRIDCSTFVGLCLRGITYENSPYAKYKDTGTTGADEDTDEDGSESDVTDADAIDTGAEGGDTWTPSTDLPSMYGTDGWEFRELDCQKDGLFNDIGLTGYSTIRSAADLGQYFYKHGRVLYDVRAHGVIGEEESSFGAVSELEMRPGDLVFWSRRDNDNETVLGRFMSISHVAMVAEDTDDYYHVTGNQEKYGQRVVWYTKFGSDSGHPISDLVLVVRPDYRPHKPKEETPIGMNLLGYPWTQSRKAEFTTNGVTYTLVDEHSLIANGTGTTGASFGLKGISNTEDHITLSPGVYELSGIEGMTGTYFALQVRYADGTDFDTPIRQPHISTNTNTFTLAEETDVIVRLWVFANKVLDNVTFTPTLIRTE